MLLGHEGNVCALDASPEGKYIVSGGWDAQARLWRVAKWETETKFEGHQGSVWAVLAYDEETVITGCADNNIRIFSISGKLLKTIKGSEDVVRALCRLPKGHKSGAHFASAGNDGIIRLWTLDGKRIAELLGHDNFIYSLAALPTGELISSGEDRTVRIWRDNECIQTITHPAISVWSVSANPDSGDIVTGASDKVVRVFTRSVDRVASEKVLAEFMEKVGSSAIPVHIAGAINKEALPGPEFLFSKSGTKEGQIQMIREDDGSISAHQWSTGAANWINVGTVVDAVGSSGKRVSYAGKEYDYVFDVDIEEGSPPLKLPFNLSQNPYEAARKFIEDNELPIAYLDQVAQFITTNTKGATLGEASGPSTGGGSWGNNPPSSTASEVTAKTLPQKAYLNILAARADIMENKIRELNTDMLKSSSPHTLSSSELSTLEELVKHISAAGSTATSQNVKGGLELAIKIATKWTYKSRLPGLDLLRLLAVAPNSATCETPGGLNFIDVLDNSVSDEDRPAENNVMLAIRAFVNLFGSAEGRKLAIAEFDKIFYIAATSLKSETTNRNLVVAVATLGINYAVLLTSSDEHKPDEAEAFEFCTQWLDLLAGVLKQQKDSEVLFRALVAVGTFLDFSSFAKAAAKEVFGMEAAVQSAFNKAIDPRVKVVGKEVLELLK